MLNNLTPKEYNNLLEEFIKATHELGQLQAQIVPLYNRQQIILVKLKKCLKGKTKPITEGFVINGGGNQ